jgi:hypothetical protein
MSINNAFFIVISAVLWLDCLSTAIPYRIKGNRYLWCAPNYNAYRSAGPSHLANFKFKISDLRSENEKARLSLIKWAFADFKFEI